MDEPLTKTLEKRNPAYVLDSFGRLTAAEVIEVIPEFLLSNIERDPIRGGALT